MKKLLQQHQAVLLVMLLTLAVRLIYLLEIQDVPDFQAPLVDEEWHWLWAEQIRTESFSGDGPFFRAPLYAYFLAFLQFVTGSSFFWVRLLQAVLSAATAGLLYRLTERLFDRTTGLVAGIVYALYGPLVFFDARLLIPVLFDFLLVLGMYRLLAAQDKYGIRAWLITGLVFGLAAATRPNILAVIPFLLIWLVLRKRKGVASKLRLQATAAMLIGVMLPIIPVTAHNYARTGDFILISSQGGVNLYLGNNAEADGLTVIMPELDRTRSIGWRDFIPETDAIARRESGRELSPGETSSFWTRKAIDFVVHSPGDFIELTGRKVVYLLSGYEQSNNVDPYQQREHSVLLSMLVWRFGLIFPFGVLLPVALAGVVLTWSTRKQLLPVYVLLLVYAGTVVVFFVTSRYRLPLTPFLIVLASAAIVRIVRAGMQGQWKMLLPALGLTAVALVFCNQTYFESGFSTEFQTHMNNGSAYQRQQDFASAEREYAQAIRILPQVGAAHGQLAYCQMQQGKLDQAETNLHTALRLEPQNPKHMANLSVLHRTRGQLDSALVTSRLALRLAGEAGYPTGELAAYQLDMAIIHKAMRRMDSARYYFETTLRTAPDLGPALAKAAGFFASVREFRRADSLFVQAEAQEAMVASDWFNWGLSLLQRGRHPEGREKLYRSIELQPDLYPAYYALATSHYETAGASDTVMALVENALRINPQFVPAVQFKERLSQDR